MEKGGYFLVFVFLILLITVIVAGVQVSLTGKAVDSGRDSGEHFVGPSAEEQACMLSCMECVSPGIGCTGNSEQCQQECSVEKPEATDETLCMEECVLVGCNEFDFACQQGNQEKCEDECGMIKEPEAQSEEERCIRDCVAEVDPNIICSGGVEGETGGGVCQRCAQECVYLYEGPCLGDEALKEKQEACETCEHCYGESLMGDSGEGWECIVDVECKDASAEFGDEPGTGEGVISGIVDGIADFFSGLFGGEETG